MMEACSSHVMMGMKQVVLYEEEKHKSLKTSNRYCMLLW